MWRRERGSVAPLLAVLVVAAGAAALGLGKIGGAAVARAQARTAADAAALAGAADGEQAARAMASANVVDKVASKTDSPRSTHARYRAWKRGAPNARTA